MMNEFGTPFNEAEECMRPKGVGNRQIDKELAESGMECQLFMALGALAGAIGGATLAGSSAAFLGLTGAAAGAAMGGLAGASIGGSIDAGNMSANAARRQAELSNEASERSYYYNTASWNMKKNQLRSDRDFAIQELEARARNEGRVADYQDIMAAQRYNYDLQIRDREQASLDAQYVRSDQIYNTQLDYNALSEKSAKGDERAKLEGILTESRYDTDEIRLQALMDEGAMRAKGQFGNSVEKAAHGVWAKAGKRIAAINASMEGAGRAAKSVLNEISIDKDTADLAAFAAKMLDPGLLPDPIMPLATPRAEYVMPRALEEYDFGPAPVMGAWYDPNAASSRAWGSTISGIASAVPSYVGMFRG